MKFGREEERGVGNCGASYGGGIKVVVKNLMVVIGGLVMGLVG